MAIAESAASATIDHQQLHPIYLRWLEASKPAIDTDWGKLRENSILDSDFFLADLFVDDRDAIDYHRRRRYSPKPLRLR